MSLHHVNTIEVEPFDVTALAISPDEQLIASGNSNGTLCVYTQSLQPAYERYDVGNASITDIAWSPVIPGILILGDSLSRIHILVLENRQDQNHGGLARYGVAEILDAGLGSIWCIDVRKDLVAVGGNKGIRIMKLRPGASLAFLCRLPLAELPSDTRAHCPSSVHIYDDEIIIATYNEGLPHGDIVAWNMVNQEKVWGLTLNDAIKLDGIFRSSLCKGTMVSAKVSGDGLDWYHLPSLSSENPAKVIYRGTTNVDAFLAEFVNDRHVVTFGNGKGCINVIDAETRVTLSTLMNPPSEAWKGFCAIARMPDRARSSNIVVAFEPLTAKSQGYCGVSIYKLDETETPAAHVPVVPRTAFCIGLALSFALVALSIVAGQRLG